MSKRLVIASWLIASLLIAPITLPAMAQEAAEDGAGMSSLDEELFNDLGSDLFDDIDLPAEAKAAPDDTKPPTGAGMQSESEDAGNIGSGDIGSGDQAEGPRGFGADQVQGEDPLTKIGGLMREVQKRIAGGQAESQTVAMQQEIIEEIEKLLDQQNNQNNQSQSSSNSQNQNQQQNQQQQQNQSQSQQQQNQQQSQQQGGQQQQQQAGQQQSQQQQQGQSQPQEQQGGDSQPGEAEMQAGETSEDSEDSSDNLRDAKVLAISPEEQDALVKKAWGNLPPHLRKQISNSSMERFLPKYERLTQEYFRKLAEIEE